MMSQGWRTGALISITLNLVVVGVVLGGALSGLRIAGPIATPSEGGPPPGQGPSFSARAFLNSLPPEERRVARQAARRSQTSAEPLFNDIRAARTELQRALSADDYDPDVALAAFERLFEVEQAMKLRGAEVTLRIAAELPEDVRKRAFANAAKRSFGHGRRTGGDHPWRQRRSERQKRLEENLPEFNER